MKKSKTVLSLFDGLAGCRIALERNGINVNKYYASEIDKYAMEVANYNYPDIIQLGDITGWREWDIDFSSIDLLTAGFPCQAWSLAGKQKGDNDPRGALVHDLIDIWNHIKTLNPNLKFMFENVKMKNEFLNYINDLFGVEPVLINSSLVSAQNRKRYYWTNIWEVEQPEDKNIVINDILEYPIYYHNITKSDKINKIGYIKKGGQGDRVYSVKGKSPTLNASSGGTAGNGNALVGELLDNIQIYPNNFIEDSIKKMVYKKLTPLECERLQTLPDNYTLIFNDRGEQKISNTQRLKMIGNGWTINVIAHLFSNL